MLDEDRTKSPNMIFTFTDCRSNDVLSAAADAVESAVVSCPIGSTGVTILEIDASVKTQ